MKLQATLDFLAELAQNNNKTWFDTNRGRYKGARSAFEALVADLIAALRSLEDLGALTPKECMFRINRDVRFARDKSPYNTHMSAAIGRGGRNGEGRSYFVQIGPGDSFVGSGLFEPDKVVLDNVRQHLVRDAGPLRDIIAAPSFVDYFGEIRGESLKTAPVGYDRNHSAIDLLRRKQFLAVHRLADADVTGAGVVEYIATACAAMTPFLDYLNEASGAAPKH